MGIDSASANGPNPLPAVTRDQLRSVAGRRQIASTRRDPHDHSPEPLARIIKAALIARAAALRPGEDFNGHDEFYALALMCAERYRQILNRWTCDNRTFHSREILDLFVGAKTRKPVYCDESECAADRATGRKQKERAVAYNTLTRVTDPIPQDEVFPKRKTSEVRSPDGTRGEGEMDHSGGPFSRWAEIAEASQWHPQKADRLLEDAEGQAQSRHLSAGTPVGQLSPPRDEDRSSPGARVLKKRRLRLASNTGRDPDALDPYLRDLDSEFAYSLRWSAMPEAEAAARKARDRAKTESEKPLGGPRGFWHESQAKLDVRIRAERRGVQLPGQVLFEEWLKGDREP